ncbi:MAG: helix-turn-helix domain-containing protein [Tumebacillaceae bacterium]
MSRTWEDVKKEISCFTDVEKEEMEINAKLIGTIAAQRNKLGLTQRQLAEKAGIKQSALARFESGAVQPRIGTVLKIAKALNLKLTISLTEEEEMTTQSDAERISHTDSIKVEPWQIQDDHV